MNEAHTPSLSRKRTACRLTELDDVLLAQILRFLASWDLEALTVAARVVSKHVLTRFPELWRALFVQRWTTLNFPLAADAQLVIDPGLLRLFPPGTTESCMWEVLTHAVVPVPSYADIAVTTRSPDYSDAKHEIQSMQSADTRPSRVVRFAFNGDELGDDRSVRANVPFPPDCHVAVFKRRNMHKEAKSLYQIGLVTSGYFEIQIVHRERPRQEEREGETHQEEDEIISLGLIPANFPLVGRQPGWNQKSFGYHGDDGRFYHQTTRGRLFGPRFGVNDTVGCGVRRKLGASQLHVFFSINGKELPQAEGSEIENLPISWYPAVGVDSYNEVRINFGQEPFTYDDIVEELFAECDPSVVSTSELPWYYIREYSIECLVGRRQQSDPTKARADANERKETISGQEVRQQDEKTCLQKWMIGMLSRRQQNRLALREDVNEEVLKH
ncbi:hypothetical protein PsorP6_004426 [Peronosclerospora sorghi]|uniref:Uncharacterized protein n=1 Tax=Peronosclerospora sorghi TaxID=230839 RepID=A0ACC0VP96_9STRA|nr:hypothetical protein PsorP6_004426 [Peronosclerospora sorghi]